MLTFKQDMISIWIGTSNQDIDKWLKCTDGVYYSMKKLPIHKILGCFMIDMDFWGEFYTPDNKVIAIENIVSEAFTNSAETNKKIIEVAKSKGIFTANRMYHYSNYIFEPEDDDPNKLYNDLLFIGNFEDPFNA